MKSQSSMKHIELTKGYEGSSSNKKSLRLSSSIHAPDKKYGTVYKQKSLVSMRASPNLKKTS